MKEGWQDKFIRSLSKGGNITLAAKAAHVSRTAAYKEREQEEDFAARWEEALTESVELLEAEARRRAVTGTLRPVYYKGEAVGSIREYSDTLMIVLLKAHKPDKYRENSRIEHTGKNGDPIEHRHNFDGLAPDELIRLHRETLEDSE